jgi:hypothetical protein
MPDQAQSPTCPSTSLDSPGAVGDKGLLWRGVGEWNVVRFGGVFDFWGLIDDEFLALRTGSSAKRDQPQF